jgi:isopenicillin-N epimerase
MLNNIAEPIWLLENKIHFLNHGSFGATPIEVLSYQNYLREKLERQPVRFLARELEKLLNSAKEELASFIKADADDIAFIPNATVGVNTILRSLTFEPEDEILITNHIYNACRNAAEFVAQPAKAKIVVASIPFPLNSSQQIVEAVLEKVSSKTKLVLLDHVTSATALVFPIETLVAELNRQGIDTLIDGAQAPGNVAIALNSLGATYYTGNCHKWLCAPKGAAFLYVRKDKQAKIRPLAISHGANSPRTDSSRFRLEFDWTGTDDPTAYLSVPKAIQFMRSLLPGGWEALIASNRNLTLEARNILCQTLNIPLPCPDEAIGSMASIPLTNFPLTWDKLQAKLIDEFNIEVKVSPWNTNTCLLRISAQLYNSLDQYHYLAKIIKEESVRRL